VIDTPLNQPLGSLLRSCTAAGAKIGEIIARIDKSGPDEAGEAWLYMTAEADPETAAFLELEGLRRRPRLRPERELWTS
jgi:hypothetical protein